MTKTRGIATVSRSNFAELFGSARCRSCAQVPVTHNMLHIYFVVLLCMCSILRTYPEDGLGDGSGETDAEAGFEVDIGLDVDESAEGDGVTTSGTVPSLGAMERVYRVCGTQNRPMRETRRRWGIERFSESKVKNEAGGLCAKILLMAGKGMRGPEGPSVDTSPNVQLVV